MRLHVHHVLFLLIMLSTSANDAFARVFSVPATNCKPLFAEIQEDRSNTFGGPSIVNARSTNSAIVICPIPINEGSEQLQSVGVAAGLHPTFQVSCSLEVSNIFGSHVITSPQGKTNLTGSLTQFGSFIIPFRRTLSFGDHLTAVCVLPDRTKLVGFRVVTTP
jgi:hypothetical protein